jgi:hypothetical protein
MKYLFEGEGFESLVDYVDAKLQKHRKERLQTKPAKKLKHRPKKGLLNRL